MFVIILIKQFLAFIFKKCDAKQFDFNSCLKIAVQDAFQKLKNPIPELDLPSFDPLYLSKKQIPRREKSDFSLDEILHSLALYNLTTAQVLEFE